MPNQNTQTLRERMLAVMADVNAQVAEREEMVEAIAIALLTRKNLFILGAPGQAKSYAITPDSEEPSFTPTGARSIPANPTARPLPAAALFKS